ncbi:MAG: hypothetical protein AAGA54_19565 [Myxococcota bacterium]
MPALNRAALGVAVLTLSLSACSADDAEPTWFDQDPLAELPADIDELGLFRVANDWDTVAEGVVGYSPVHPLWSSGSVKRRHVFVPRDGDVGRDGDAFTFPPGTLLFKTFLYPDGSEDLVPVETRVMRMDADARWEYAVYQWEDPQTATLIDTTLETPATRPDGGTHTIPATLECRGCHESADSEALGWDDIQLADAFTALVDEGVLDESDVAPARIEADDDLTAAVLGDLYANCVHCHNGTDGPSSAFDLRPDAALGNMIDVETESSATASGIRVVPGSPEDSILFLALSRETDDPEVKEMPPVGIDELDRDSIERMRTWIQSL